jgi:hypothetical protein
VLKSWFLTENWKVPGWDATFAHATDKANIATQSRPWLSIVASALCGVKMDAFSQ